MRRVAAITGTRAEYRLLRRTLLKLQAEDSIHLMLYVTGSHLVPECGNTRAEIVADGFSIAGEIAIVDASVPDGPLRVARAMAVAIENFSRQFTVDKPEVILLLGDRYEIFAAAQAALLCNIPVAHIHGGEVTTGAIDDSMRHCISKLSNLHLVATERHRQRVVQLGEQPDSVVVVGAPGLENIDSTTYATLGKTQLEQALGIRLTAPVALITYHPETLSSLSPVQQIDTVLAALDRIDGLTCVFTAPNIDSGGQQIGQRIQEFVQKLPARRFFVASLGERYYLSIVNHVDVVVGNSSSGIIEVPALGIPTVNIGNRQRGRERASSVTDVNCDTDAIVKTVERALKKGRQKTVVHPYQSADQGVITSDKIVAAIKAWDFSGGASKVFYDLPQRLNKVAVV